MIVLIALVTGITDLAALIGIAFANIAMIRSAGSWRSPTTASCTDATSHPFAGSEPGGPGSGSAASPASGPGWRSACTVGGDRGAEGQGHPGFVWGILISLFVLFNTFALNQWLQYRQVGRWRDYLFGEWQYVILSLVAKSVLAGQPSRTP